MSRGRALVVGMGVLLLMATPARSAELPRPTVDFSADVVVNTTGDKPTTVNGKVYISGKKERRETNLMGHETVLITRRDKQAMWVLMPQQHMYMENQVGGRTEDAYDKWRKEGVTVTKLGNEKVNGMEAIKYRATSTTKDGQKHTGLLWMTKENIPVRLETETEEEPAGRVTVDFTHIKIGKQDPALFEIPAGYQKMTIPNFGHLSPPPARGGRPEAGTPPTSQPTPEQMRQIQERIQQQMQQMFNRSGK